MRTVSEPGQCCCSAKRRPLHGAEERIPPPTALLQKLPRVGGAGAWHQDYGYCSRIAFPAAERLSSRISEYLRERMSPSAPARNAAATAA